MWSQSRLVVREYVHAEPAYALDRGEQRGAAVNGTVTSGGSRE
jgi:hypothetical protein